MQNWCFSIGQIVETNMEKEITGLPDNEKYEVIERYKGEENEEYYTIKSLSSGKIFESVAASLIDEI